MKKILVVMMTVVVMATMMVGCGTTTPKSEKPLDNTTIVVDDTVERPEKEVAPSKPVEELEVVTVVFKKEVFGSNLDCVLDEPLHGQYDLFTADMEELGEDEEGNLIYNYGDGVCKSGDIVEITFTIYFDSPYLDHYDYVIAKAEQTSLEGWGRNSSTLVLFQPRVPGPHARFLHGSAVSTNYSAKNQAICTVDIFP